MASDIHAQKPQLVRNVQTTSLHLWSNNEGQRKFPVLRELYFAVRNIRLIDIWEPGANRKSGQMLKAKVSKNLLAELLARLHELYEYRYQPAVMQKEIWR